MHSILKGLILVSATIMPLATIAENIDLFVMAGQSNMQGWKSDARRYPRDVQDLDQRILFYWRSPGISSSGGLWKTLRPQSGLFPDGHFGPEITFARKLKLAGYNPAIFKFTLGGAGLGADWKPQEPSGLYEMMRSELNEAVKKLEMKGKNVVPRLFVWVQGESDANPKYIKNYEKSLNHIIDNMRQEVFHDCRLPIILGVDEQHPDVVRFPEIIQSQKRIAGRERYVERTSMLGLEKVDATHLSPAGVAQQGLRIFEVYMSLENHQNSTTLNE
jgi:Carbohydrate esterase, sialic acid-specific acetylesterase